MVKEVLQWYGAMIEKALARAMPREECPQREVFEACRYSLLAGGKRIRPCLLLEFYRLCGGNPQDALAFACGLEMIHTYSLIHDDLPCMDNDDYRRGRPSNHKIYGAGMATLAGDALLTRAFEVMLSQDRIPPERAIKAAAYIAGCSGVYGMIGGQVQDLALEKQRATEAQLTRMVDGKTAALLRAACVRGCLLAGGGEDALRAARTYARKLGLAFQIRDDILDVTGDSAKLGKKTGIDLPGEQLIGVIVVGVGLPTPSARLRAVQRCYQQHFGDGFGYACRIPAMQKVLQAGGRVIRSENDRGILLLLDSRYYESAWRPFGEDVPQAAKALWGEPS